MLAAVPIAYFAFRIHDGPFLDGAMGNWFATMMGLAVGVPIGLALDRRQKRVDEAAVQRRKGIETKMRLLQATHNLGDEIAVNRDHLLKLPKILSATRGARADVWTVSRSIVDGFSFVVFETLRPSAEYPIILTEAGAISSFYLVLNKLAHDVRIAANMHDFYFSYGGGEPAADKQLKAIAEELEIVIDALDRAEAAQRKLLQSIA